MINALKNFSKGGSKSLSRSKSTARVSLEKSTRSWSVGLGVVLAISIISDVITTARREFK